VVPPILMETGKVKNPWPNVDAHSGVLLQVSTIVSWKIIITLKGNYLQQKIARIAKYRVSNCM